MELRIISICPSNTEVVAWLEAEHMLVAVDNSSDWPKSINTLPRLGPDLSIDMNRLEQLEPDLVLSSLSVPGMERNVEELEKRGIPQLILNPQSLADITDDIRKVGHALQLENVANEKALEFQQEIDRYRKKNENRQYVPTIYFEWWPKPIFTPGQTNWLTEIAELAGGRNCFSDVELASVKTDWDDVVRRNPDYICLAWVGVKQEKMSIKHVLNRPSTENMKAVKTRQIHLLEEELYCRPSPRLLEGLRKLDSIISISSCVND